MIPRDTHDQLIAYVQLRRPPGGFLFAVLANDLCGAVRHADDANRAALVELAGFVEANLPAKCRGSVERVRAWLGQDPVLPAPHPSTPAPACPSCDGPLREKRCELWCDRCLIAVESCADGGDLGVEARP